MVQILACQPPPPPEPMQQVEVHIEPPEPCSESLLNDVQSPGELDIPNPDHSSPVDHLTNISAQTRISQQSTDYSCHERTENYQFSTSADTSFIPLTSSTSYLYTNGTSTSAFYDLAQKQPDYLPEYNPSETLESISSTEYHEKQYTPVHETYDCSLININDIDNYQSQMSHQSPQSHLTASSYNLQDVVQTNISDLNAENMNCNETLDLSSQVKMEQIDNLPRVRRDSSESMETISSESSGETFNTTYLDTVSSVNSTSFLIKSNDSDEEMPEERTPEAVKEIYFNTGYASSSSSETLDTDKEDGNEYPYNQNQEMPYQPLLDSKTQNEGNDQVTVVIEDCCDEDNGQENSNLADFVPHLLIPIKEHDIVSFTVEEVEPCMYTKITNNITVADESFLLESQTSLWEPESTKSGKRAATMQNLHERTSFLDLTEVSKIGRACQKALVFLKDDMAFGSIASLNNLPANKNFDETDPTQGISLIDGSKSVNIIPSTRHTRNLVALSLCITLLFIAIGSVRNLQSSINHEGGVGVISMAVTFVGYMIGSIFSSSIVQNFQPRQCIILNLIPNLLYVAANMYPALWLMVPISFVQGVSSAIIWNAATTYITFLARGRAQKKNESLTIVSGRYYGIYCLIFQSNIIIGNLIASLVLMFGNTPGSSQVASNATQLNESFPISQDEILSENLVYNEGNAVPISVDELSATVPEASLNLTGNTLSHLSICGGKFCQHFEIGGTGFVVSEETKYTLFGIYLGCVVMSMLIAMFMLEPLSNHLFLSPMRPLQKVKSQLLSLAKFSVNRNFLLLLPLCMYTTMQYGFVSAEFTKAYVTCPLGIHMVGYTMICLGVCGSVSSYLSGLLNKFTGRIAPIILAKLKRFNLEKKSRRDAKSPPPLLSCWLID